MTFADDFLWGCGASSLSLRGSARRSDWRRFEEVGRQPQSRDGYAFASSIESAEADLAMVKEAGLDHLRLSVDWARIEPHSGSIDREEVETLLAIADAASSHGLQLWISLFDETQPGWFADDTDGFTSGQCPLHWARHVDRMAELFDHAAAGWIPMRDPIGAAFRSQLWGIRPPGHRSFDKTLTTVEGMIASTFEAWRLLSSGSQPIVGSFSPAILRERVDQEGLTLAASADDLEPHERDALGSVSWWKEILNDVWLDIISEAVYSLPWKASRECPEWAGAFDIVELVRTGPFSVDPGGALASWPSTARRDAVGQSVDPTALPELVHAIAGRLGDKPIMLGGLHLVTNDDAEREAFTMAMLEVANELINDGVDLQGLFFDPIVDGYHPGVGFDVDAGWFTRGRDAKPSLRWITAQT